MTAEGIMGCGVWDFRVWALGIWGFRVRIVLSEGTWDLADFRASRKGGGGGSTLPLLTLKILVLEPESC